MPFPSFEKLSELLPQQTLNWARQVAAQMQGWLSIEHHDDGTHSDISADSLTLIPPGTIVLTDENGVTTTLAASRRDSPFDLRESALRVTVDVETVSGSRPVVIDLGYLNPHLSGYADGPGLFIPEPLIETTIGSQRNGWAITASIADLLLSGRSMLAITDTVEDKSMLAIRPVGAAGAVSGYVFGPLNGGTAALGTPIYLGRAATGERWAAIHAIDIVASGAITASTLNVTSFTVATLIVTTNVVSPVYIVGTADTNGIRLDVVGGFLRVVEGDGSAFGPMQAGTIISNSGYIQSASSYLYLGASASASEVLLRKVTTGSLGVRLGDDSDYGDLYARNAVFSGGRVHWGPISTSGALLRLNSGTPELREGDDSGYNDLILRDLGANGNITATGAVTAASVAASGAVTAATVAASSTVTATSSMTTATMNATSVVASSTAVVAGTTIANAGGSVGYSVALASGAFGTGAIGGSYVQIGANTSGSGAAGTLILQRRGGTVDAIWSDNAGLMRTNTGQPNESGAFGFSDTAGTVVGDQTSQRAAKYDITERFDYESSLNVVLDAAVYDFRYKDHRYNDELFTGIITDQAPLFGKDRGKALNEVSAIGHLIQAIKAQQQQIERLESELIALRKRVE